MPFMYIKFIMTLLWAFTFCGGFQHYYFSFRFRNGKTLPKSECADRDFLLEESCVRNFRNPLFAKLLLFKILGHFQKLFWAKILGNFRTFTVLCFFNNIYIYIYFFFLFRFYGPVNPMGSCRAQSVYLTTHLLGRLSPLSD